MDNSISSTPATGTPTSSTSASPTSDAPTQDVPLGTAPLLAARGPVSARALASWSALWSANAPEDSGLDDSMIDDSTLATGGFGGGQQHLTDSRGHTGTGDSSLPLYQQLMANPLPDPQAVAAAPDPDVTFAELLERHVRRTLASTSPARANSDEVRIELTDVVLPDTSLSLKRGPQGWSLLAVTGNRNSLERLDRFTPALIRRFAAASLGELEVVTQLAPSAADSAA